MGFVLSLFVIGAGAVLRYALKVDSDVIDLNMVGSIVMIVGTGSAIATGVNWIRDTWFEAEEHDHAAQASTRSGGDDTVVATSPVWTKN